uniref:RNase H type-1 domain-containing protein n=1 Tax=Chromera velia CCMP2878 TaxID=1169474 RepID=A0A0G4HMG3_9ALVE|eukprot:Cvel_7485.t1-p1 / transcript=Cvel_7485.t1 / gene=Cvel_7485 / organism=Chromera_velia_CCMP2878 / gene_product=hypothetical protein / transcript_product=hypothetical protein / location=Cvel_scaffold392:51588-51812(-) / protein_length=75 / sequence_SO=supercontig / SO=protein_coding / is_pseudo=false
MWQKKRIKVILYTDSSPLHDQVWSGKAQTDSTMQEVLAWYMQELKAAGADLVWTSCKKNVANVLMKCAFPGGELA